MMKKTFFGLLTAAGMALQTGLTMAWHFPDDGDYSRNNWASEARKGKNVTKAVGDFNGDGKFDEALYLFSDDVKGHWALLVYFGQPDGSRKSHTIDYLGFGGDATTTGISKQPRGTVTPCCEPGARPINVSYDSIRLTDFRSAKDRVLIWDPAAQKFQQHSTNRMNTVLRPQ